MNLFFSQVNLFVLLISNEKYIFLIFKFLLLFKKCIINELLSGLVDSAMINNNI